MYRLFHPISACAERLITVATARPFAVANAAKVAATVATAAILLAATPSLQAQESKTRDPERRVESVRVAPRIFSFMTEASSTRAVLGVTLSVGTRTDTAGVLIDDVDANGPAAKAGVKAGDIITEINGVNLRISAADAADPALSGLGQRRLQRAMAAVKAGDDVDLRLKSGSGVRAAKVKTVSAADLSGGSAQNRLFSVRGNDDTRGAIGVTIGGASNLRDTLGLFVSSVVSEGPAEQAGIYEGDRIAAVNGVDVRVPKEDVKDMAVASSRVDRFVKAVQDVAPGGTVRLRVYSAGKYREVSVKAVKMSELPSGSVNMFFGNEGGQIGRIRINGKELEFNSDAFEDSMQKLRNRMQELGRDMQFEFRTAPSESRRRATDGATAPVIRFRTLPRRTTTIL